MKSILKLLIDIGPLAVFFIFYTRSGLQASILPLMIATVIAVIISYILEKKIPIMPTVGAGIVIIFGGLTIYFNDEIFIKIRSTGRLIKSKLKLHENKKGDVELLEDEYGISPGQACVFYKKDNNGDKLLGGGWITN